MGSSNSISKIEDNNENYIKITYRVKLPTNPIVSKEKDENFLFCNTVENMEKAKVFMNMGNPNLFSYYNVINMNFSFMSLVPVLFIALYRRFKIKKLNTKLMSTAKALPFVIAYIALENMTIVDFQQDFYFKFIKEELMPNDTTDDINSYLEFKNIYNNMLQH
jgi:hypothetical protein